MARYMRVIVLAALLLIVAGRVMAATLLIDEGDGVFITEDGLTDTYIVQFDVGAGAPPLQDVVYTATADGQCTVQTPDGGNTQLIAAGTTGPFSVTVTAVDDNVAESQPHFCVIQHSTTSGDPDYDTLVSSPTSAEITDNDTAEILFSPASVTIDEEGTTSATYQVNTATEPIDDVTLTLSTDGECTITNPASGIVTLAQGSTAPVDVTVEAVDDSIVEASPHPCVITHSVSSPLDTIYDALGDQPYTANVNDNDTPDITPPTAALTVTEPNGTDTFDMALGTTPSDSVFIDFLPDNAFCTVTSSNPLELTDTTPIQVVVEAVDDVITNGTRTCTISRTVTSDDTDYDGFILGDITVTVQDDDVAAVSFSPASGLNVDEEGPTSSTYEIRLVTQPVAPVTAINAVPDAQCTVTNITGLPLSNTTDFATVTVQAVDDGLVEGGHTCEITHTLTSADPAYNNLTANYSVNVTDNESPTVSVSAPTGDLPENGVTTQEYSITLSVPPTQAVTILATPADGQCQVTLQPATFPIGSTGPNIVRVLATADNIDEPDPHPCVINHVITSTGGNYDGVLVPDATLNIIDDDLVQIDISNETIVEDNAGTSIMTFDVTLSNPSTSIITVNYTTADDTATVADGDYDADSDLITFNPSVTTMPVDITINGDTNDEGISEQFFVNLSGATGGAVFANTQGIGTITDDDGPVVPNVSISDLTAVETNSGTTIFNFNVNLDVSTTIAVSVDYATANDTATAGSDYTAVVAGTVNFPIGSTTQPASVTVNGDTTPELNETFFVNLTNPQGVTITDAQAVGTITNDDVTVAIGPDVSAAEGLSGPTPFTFTVTVTGALSSPLTVNYNTTDGTATTADNDYTAVTNALTFNPSASLSQTQNIVVDVTGDTNIEPDETFSVDLTAPGVTITDAQAIGTITDDDAAVVPNVSISDPPAQDESDSGQVAFTFTVTLDVLPTTDLIINYTTTDGSATTADNDYTAVTNSLTFTPTGSLTQNITVQVNGDTTVEPDETFNVVISTTGTATITDDTGIGTITNDDSPAVIPNVSISDPPAQDESDSGQVAFTFTVTLDVLPTTDLIINYTTTDGSATTADNDYTAVTNSLTFTPTGSLTQTITVQVNGDTTVEPNETFNVVISTTGTATITDDTGVGTITDDDTVAVVPNVSINDAPAQFEGNSGQTIFVFTVTMDVLPATDVIINYTTVNGTATTADNDYTATSGTLTFGPSNTDLIQEVAVQVLGDTTPEPSETFFVNLTSSGGVVITDASGVGLILDDDTPTTIPSVSINDVTLNEGNGGVTGFVFTVTFTSLPASDVEIAFNTAGGTATAGSDYAATSGILTFTPTGALTQTITVQVNGDTSNEADETFNVVISTTSGAVTISDNTGLGTIVNDDSGSTLPTVRINDVSVTEGTNVTTTMTFTVTLNQAATAPVTVTYSTANESAQSGSDYTAIVNQTVTFNVGQTSRPITVQVIGDTADEPNETFVVDFISVTGATIARGRGRGTILDDDGGNDAVTTTPTPVPTATPIPTMALCADMDGTTNPIIRAEVPAGTVTNGNVYCRVLAENGRFIYVGEAGSVGNQQVLDLGVIHAVDVFGLLAGGVSTRDFNNGVVVCLQGEGSLIYLDARGAPRPPVRLTNTSSQSGYTCGTIPSAGTVVLVGQPGTLPGLATGQGGGGSGGPAFGLSDCNVTTLMRLNLRVWAGLDGRILTIVPEGVTVPAFERTRRWYRVSYGTFDGWISAFYVRPQGNCGQ